MSFAGLPSMSYDLGSPRSKSKNLKLVTIEDTAPPLMVRNNLTDYSVVQVLPQQLQARGLLLPTQRMIITYLPQSL